MVNIADQHGLSLHHTDHARWIVVLPPGSKPHTDDRLVPADAAGARAVTGRRAVGAAATTDRTTDATAASHAAPSPGVQTRRIPKEYVFR
jgi:hypothetical protein